MDINLIIFVVAAVSGITILYKVLPHRNIGTKKPVISLLPKYRTWVTLPSSVSNANNPMEELEKILSKYGFIKKSQGGETSKYSRGHILGDFSVKLAKVNLLVTVPKSNGVDMFIEAGWVVAFDTGDFWKFLTELKQKIETD
ncbi:MAG: hypothetical protein OEV42_01095 [Deltaproteobacteria bacterium]|nr:hypothetical protein [Deltaproteobacteria bacterium]